MKRTIMTGCAALAFALFAGPAGAQQYRFDVGVDGGLAYFTSMLSEEDHGVAEDVAFNAGWISGFEATGWLNDNFGIRFDLGYTEKAIKQGDNDVLFDNEDGDVLEDVNLWDVAGSLVWRFMGPNEGEFLGVEFMPYVFGGAGVKIFDPATDGDRFGVALATDADPTPAADNFFFAGETKLEGRVGLGADIRVLRSLIVRLEAGDIMFDSPFYEDATTEEDIGNVVHELYGTIGLAVPFGFIVPPPVVVAPPPPPPAPVTPAPREERVTVCVIDPTQDTGIRTVQAIYLVDEGDTVVVQGNNRVALRSTTGSVVVAPRTSWYVAGEPLVFTTAPNTRVEYTSYGGARVIPSGSLAYLGNQQGIAVYADADDVADVREQWRELRNANRAGDVDDILENRAELVEEFNEIEFLYVPMDPVGCVFQALQRVEEIGKEADD
ncbi:MAG TPA: outer membrane beta-barrel protein [Longimicrobiales bacterium]